MLVFCWSVILISVNANSLSAHDPKQRVLANKIFANFDRPTFEPSKAIGSYAKGCLGGGVALPFKGDTWQVMHPARNRNWGHSVTIEFVKRLSKTAKEIGWSGLFIGDISQPRGGPMPNLHKSHQMGLDVDFWLTPPPKMYLSRSELQAIKHFSVRTRDLKSTNKHWTKAHMEILKAAASDEVVDRVFITAPAKIWMCKNADVPRDWLQKIRPIRGHNKHFHVRLKCPPSATHCVSQKPSIKDISQSKDGCDDTLNWWVTTALEPYKKPQTPIKKRPKKKDALSYLIEDLPKECTSIIHVD